MKLTRDRLKQIIKEELSEMMGSEILNVDTDKLSKALAMVGLDRQADAVKNQRNLYLRPGPEGSFIVSRSANSDAPQPLFNISADYWNKIKATGLV